MTYTRVIKQKALTFEAALSWGCGRVSEITVGSRKWQKNKEQPRRLEH